MKLARGSAAFIGVAALLLQLAAARGRPCFHPSGERSADVPCEAGATVSVCCTSAEACLPDGLCRLLDDDDQDKSGVINAPGTCTDPSWASDICFPKHLFAQDSHGSRTSPFVARRAPETTAAASPADGSSGSGGGLGTGAKAGIGIGVALGIVALGAAGYLQRRARLKRRGSGPPGAGDEKSGRQHGYEMDEAAGKGHGGRSPPIICEGGTCSRARMVGA
ncbi:hypothetical protein LX36DRAFT_585048 [Colletotrichum falcatum]|nr:hypothetical protein LX36DRAFT_585048 [Colletotrichum falcatum]